MIDDIFVIDGVTHAFDMSEENFENDRYARPVNEFLGNLLATAPDGYAIEAEAAWRDWTVDDAANLLFRESLTDIGIFHHTPIYFYKDGLSGLHKSVEAVKRFPDRFIGSYVAVDPLHDDPIGQLERGFELLEGKVLGLKLYPVSYTDGKVVPWRMDDPTIAFKLYERVAELGVPHVAVHKSLPLGPAPALDAFRPGDVEGAAVEYPEITFEIVHGGFSFTEETAWLVGRYPNIWLNLETFAINAVLRPRVFAEAFAKVLAVGGEAVLDKMIWASGAMNYHPRPQLEAFMDFTIPQDLIEGTGNFWEIPQLTREHKRNILGGNFARMHGLDLEQLAAAIADDEFSKAQAAGLAAPYSTTPLADRVIAPVG